ncbi:LytR/AlgR family response regulator transcription factor [Desulfobacter vibrioformis]|uniref:LytR/AlgR family response regulator transcription factor n=1 Tax=Desulfobacter vibrioformis TaxID=34031 RepID=UPI000557D1F2|nr:LytTR family DNA-binding domain-containing protein [Desulfobacter vibrioformis]
MTGLRVVIVDDEPIARQALRRMLLDFSDIRICGEAGSVDEAERLINDTRADLVFLDIELYGESGFDLVPRLDSKTAVVFVTAFNQYAIRAFEVNALDYLLKPVAKDRLAQSIRRRRKQQKLQPRLTLAQDLSLEDVIFVQNGKRRCWLALKKLCLIKASGDFTVLHATDGISGMVWRSLRQWEKLLPQDQFMRIHRGMIVNVNYINAFESVSGQRLKLYLTGLAEPCIASRRITPQLRKLLL